MTDAIPIQTIGALMLALDHVLHYQGLEWLRTLWLCRRGTPLIATARHHGAPRPVSAPSPRALPPIFSRERVP